MRSSGGSTLYQLCKRKHHQHGLGLFGRFRLHAAQLESVSSVPLTMIVNGTAETDPIMIINVTEETDSTMIVNGTAETDVLHCDR